MIMPKMKHMHMRSLLMSSLTVLMSFPMKLLDFLIRTIWTLTKRSLSIRKSCPVVIQRTKFHLNLFIVTTSSLMNNHYTFSLSLQKQFILTSWSTMRASQPTITITTLIIWIYWGLHMIYSLMNMYQMNDLIQLSLLGL